MTSLRCNLSESTTENLLKIRLNLSKIQYKEIEGSDTGAQHHIHTGIDNLLEQEAEEEDLELDDM